MVTKEDVINCYRYILGRSPENDEVVNSFLATTSVELLRKKFINSAEFMNNTEHSADIENLMPPRMLGKNLIECDASPAELKLLCNRIKAEWEQFGNSDPHWSVITDEKFKRNFLQHNIDEFFESGKFVVEIVKSFFDRCDIEIKNFDKCFELGCGVGRITIHLAQLFQNVIAADISRAHLDFCDSELKHRGVLNAETICLDSPDRLRDIPAIDFFCSFIVLQHNPPPLIKFMLNAILSKLTPGGIAIFQLPTWRRGYSFTLSEYLHNPKPLHMEMHVLSQAQVLGIITSNNCNLIELREDGWAEGRTTETLSNTFFIKKNES